MKIEFPISSSSSNDVITITIEVKCAKKPQIRVGDHFIGISPIEDFNFIDEKSSTNWRDRFLVGPSPYKGISIYGNNPEDLFYMEYPSIIEE